MSFQTRTVAVSIARVLLGLTFFVCGLDGFLHFFPIPTEPPPEGAMALAMGFVKSGYMFPLIKGTEVLAGALLLSNRFVPLALALLAPIVINIVAFHVFLLRDGLVLALVLLGLEIALAWAYRAAYRPMLTATHSRAAHV